MVKIILRDIRNSKPSSKNNKKKLVKFTKNILLSNTIELLHQK